MRKFEFIRMGAMFVVFVLFLFYFISTIVFTFLNSETTISKPELLGLVLKYRTLMPI